MTPERSLEILFDIATASTEFDLECSVMDAIGRFEYDDMEGCVNEASRKMRDNVKSALRTGSSDDALSLIDEKASRILDLLEGRREG